MTDQTPEQRAAAVRRVQRVRRRKKLNVVAVVIPSQNLSIDIPADRLPEVLAMAVDDN